MDWAAEHLLVTLLRLEGALREYYGSGGGGGGRGRGFAGLDLVVMQVRRCMYTLYLSVRVYVCVQTCPPTIKFDQSKLNSTNQIKTARRGAGHGAGRGGGPGAPLPLGPALAVGGGAGGGDAAGSKRKRRGRGGWID